MDNRLQIREGIIKALCYADVFDFPLNKREIYKFFVGKNSVSSEVFNKELLHLMRADLIGKDNYYFLKGRHLACGIRKKRRLISREKIAIAKRVAGKISMLPTIKFIGISGSVSMHNAKKEDDIDLFFITSGSTLWITRFLVNIFLFAIGYKRSRKESFGTNKICPNMFLSLDSLAIPHNKQNIYTAHEVAQLMPIVNKDNVYENFIGSNIWIYDYLPNLPRFKNSPKPKSTKNFVVSLINDIVYLMQYTYMMKRITNEEIKPNMARFHPKEQGMHIEYIYNLRLNEYLNPVVENVKRGGGVAHDTPGY